MNWSTKEAINYCLSNLRWKTINPEMIEKIEDISKDTKTVIFRIPNSQLEIGISFKRKVKVSCYVPFTSKNGKSFPDGNVSEIHSDIKINMLYPRSDGKEISGSVSRYAPSLCSDKKPRLIDAQSKEAFIALLAWLLGENIGDGINNEVLMNDLNLPININGKKQHRKLTLDDLEKRLARQREVGALGEDVAFRHEYLRLSLLDCDKPNNHIKKHSEDDVGAGYDLSSEFNGEIRFIEVKSSVISNESFFLSENEKIILAELGESAYIYLVKIDELDQKNSMVVNEIRNPMTDPKLILEPVAYKVTVNRD